MGKRAAQNDTIIDINSDSQVNSNFPQRWSPASLTFNNYFYLFLRSCPIVNIVFLPLLLLPLCSFPFTVPCRIAVAKPEDIQTFKNYLSFRVLTRVRSSLYSPMLLGSFCKPPHWKRDPCTKCSIVFGSISSQRSAFFSLTLQSRALIHRHTEIWKWQKCASVSP